MEKAIKNLIEKTRKLIGVFAAAFGMFSAIPVPDFLYLYLYQDENIDINNNKYILCAFPVIGLVIGISCQVWILFCDWLSLSDILRGAGLCLLPVIITGGIHLDGYADTCDALASYASPERRREILKDPRRGAFAIIKLCAYFIALFALCTALYIENACILIWIFIFSRCLSGIALLFFILSKNNGMAYNFKTQADQKSRKIILLEAVLTGLILCVFYKLTGLIILITALWNLKRADDIARRDFGGWSGDLAGWFLQKAELYMLAALVFAQYIGDKII